MFMVITSQRLNELVLTYFLYLTFKRRECRKSDWETNATRSQSVTRHIFLLHVRILPEVLYLV